MTRFIVGRLRPKSTYFISIYAINKGGDGQISTFPIAETLEDSITTGTIFVLKNEMK